MWLKSVYFKFQTVKFTNRTILFIVNIFVKLKDKIDSVKFETTYVKLYLSNI